MEIFRRNTGTAQLSGKYAFDFTEAEVEFNRLPKEERILLVTQQELAAFPTDLKGSLDKAYRIGYLFQKYQKLVTLGHNEYKLTTRMLGELVKEIAGQQNERISDEYQRGLRDAHQEYSDKHLNR